MITLKASCFLHACTEKRSHRQTMQGGSVGQLKYDCPMAGSAECVEEPRDRSPLGLLSCDPHKDMLSIISGRNVMKRLL
jgi:hypothetical protein